MDEYILSVEWPIRQLHQLLSAVLKEEGSLMGLIPLVNSAWLFSKNWIPFSYSLQ